MMILAILSGGLLLFWGAVLALFAGMAWLWARA